MARLVFYEFAEECPRCKAVAWEHVELFTRPRQKDKDIIACCFCGYRLRVKARPATQQGVFRFTSGRFEGMTLEEVEAQPNGRRYLELMKDKAPVAEFLASASP